MGQCSYTWRDKDERGYLDKRCAGEIWKGSDRFCIFHDRSPDKDPDLFEERLREQMISESEKHNFIGYYFPKNRNFSGQEFSIDADFRGATFQDANFERATFQKLANFGRATFQGDTHFGGVFFQGDANFWKAIFQDADFEKASFDGVASFRESIFIGNAYFGETDFRDANFWKATFYGTANFTNAVFQDIAYLRGATFQDANFERATFQDADFERATFEKKLDFTPDRVEWIDFRDAEFLYRSKVTANLEEALYQGAFIENVAFIDCTWPEDYVIYEEKHMNDEEINLSYQQLETVYRDLKQNMQNHGDYSTAGELYYREMEMRRKGATKIRERAGLEVYKNLAGYGERYWNTAIVSTFIVSLFAFLYGALNCLHYSIENPSLQQKTVDVIYFSFVTFTTLGLGDIAPATILGKVLICFEAVIGAFMIAVFVVVFVRKMAR